MFGFLLHVEKQQISEFALESFENILFKAASRFDHGQSLFLNCNDVSIEVHNLVYQGDGTRLGTNEVQEDLPTS